VRKLVSGMAAALAAAVALYGLRHPPLAPALGERLLRKSSPNCPAMNWWSGRFLNATRAITVHAPPAGRLAMAAADGLSARGGLVQL